MVKKLLNITRKKKKKHDIILMLTKSKCNSIETISQALIDMKINHEEFITILNEKDKYEKMKDNLRSENEKYKIMSLSGVKSKTPKQIIHMCLKETSCKQHKNNEDIKKMKCKDI